MVFSKCLFDQFDSSQILRKKMNGFNDPELINFDFIASYPLMEQEYKEEYGETEYIKSYLQGAKVLCDSIERVNGFKIINCHSLTLPIIYLCRQCIELTLKHHIRKLKGNTKKIHKIGELWEELKNELKVNPTDEEYHIIENMESFIDTMLSIDDNGTRLRYAKQNDSSYSHEGPRFVNVNRLSEFTEKFVNQLDALEDITFN